jgi:phage terminase large subunit
MITLELTDRQIQALQALNDKDVVDVLYGGAKGGGKSWFLCWWAYWLAAQIIEQFDLQPSDTPPHIGFIGRKQSVDFTMTTLQTWQEVIPRSTYAIKGATDRHPKHILIDGRAAIDFGGFDRQETINKFNSAEFVFIGIDQAEELTQDDVSVLRASRRMKLGGKQLRYKGLWTANPAQSWLKQEFITHPPACNRFIQALPSDNPHLPGSYVETLKEAFKHRPELLEAYLHGSWDAFEGADQIIKSEWVRLAAARLGEHRRYARKVITCDPARFGDDETVIYYLEDLSIRDVIIYGQKDTMHTAGRLAAMAEKYHCPVVVDAIGIGAGVVDRLVEIGGGIEVVAIVSSEKATVERYYNLRAQMWDEVARQFSDGAIALASDDFRLHNQLCTPCYKFKGGKMAVEEKDEIKKRLNCSPDRADAYVQGAWYSLGMPTSYEEKRADLIMGSEPDVGVYDPLSHVRSYSPIGVY